MPPPDPHWSDPPFLDTKARKTASGCVVTGEKAFITSGSKADFFVVLDETDSGVTTFAVDRDAPGVSTRETRQAETLGLRNGPHVNLVLDEVELAEDALIGVEGKGLDQAMITLSSSRTLVAGISRGIARAAFDESFAYVSERSAFGGKVIDFQGIQWYFAEASAELDAARLLCYQAARDLDGGGDYQRSSSAAKLVAAALATKIASMAVQVCGAPLVAAVGGRGPAAVRDRGGAGRVGGTRPPAQQHRARPAHLPDPGCPRLRPGRRRSADRLSGGCRAQPHAGR